MSDQNIQEIVKQKYSAAAKQAAAGQVASCGGGGELSCCDPISRDLYGSAEIAGLPEKAVAASLGCGNPTALAQLQAGETVLDLGSGGGDEMLALARENQQKSGVTNVEFLKGTIENIPLPDNSVDVIISNCVINLSGDKDRVFREAFRVLKPGGRFAISDVVVRGEVPPEIRKSMELWVGCIAGALEEYEYRDKLFRAGFEFIDIEPTRVYKSDEARDFLANAGLDADKVAPLIDGKFISAFIRAQKPNSRGSVVGPSCCAPTCCN